ncbi:HisA/HisF-related TIM barrel protein [Nitrincola sp. A-D6]|uniref:HisA/HisF-related TIM barrel protein n=1 Tax=Nitrincola sp. A-D6 TaxID=1545442 RepID=UPI00068BAB3B|nr:HisA/HisF-related TIM barrel protein [Nitrincola sp. A-D6]
MLPRLIPSLTLIDNQIYRTKNFKNPSYVGDPINAVKIFNEKKVDELIIFDIGKNKKIISEDFVAEMLDITSQAFMPLSYGGGIRTIDDADKVFKAGFDKVIIGNSTLKNLSLIEDISNKYGKQSLVFALDIITSKFFGTYIHGLSPFIKKNRYYAMLALELEKKGVGELIIRDVSLMD